MFPHFNNNQTNNQFQLSSRVVIQTQLSQAAMEDLHLPSLRAMVGHLHHHNQTMAPLQTQLHRSVQVLCMVVQPHLSSLVVMVMVQVNNLDMDHLLQRSSQATLHRLPQDHSKVAMAQGQDSLATAPLDHRRIMEQWPSHLHKLDRVWVTMLLPAVEVEAIVTNPHSSSSQDMEEQMQEVVEILPLLLLVGVVAAVVEEPPVLFLSLVHMCLQQHKDSPSNHHHNQIRAVTAAKLVLDQDLVDMDLQMLHHHPLLEVHPSPVLRTHTHRQQFLPAWLHQHQHRHIHKDQAVLHHNRVTLLLHRQVGVILHHKHNSSLSSNNHRHNHHHHSLLQQLKQDFSHHRSSQALRDPHQLVLNLSNQVVMVSHHLSLFLLQLRHMCHHLQEVHKVSLRPILHILLDHSILILDILSKPMDLKPTLHLHKLDINIHDPQLRKCHLLGHRVPHPKASMELMTKVDFLAISHHHNNLERRT